jgi:hypothetical protein
VETKNVNGLRSSPSEPQIRKKIHNGDKERTEGEEETVGMLFDLLKAHDVNQEKTKTIKQICEERYVLLLYHVSFV